jgi:hypothetical protein
VRRSTYERATEVQGYTALFGRVLIKAPHHLSEGRPLTLREVDEQINARAPEQGRTGELGEVVLRGEELWANDLRGDILSVNPRDDRLRAVEIELEEWVPSLKDAQRVTEVLVDLPSVA